ncbi:MAG TPA: GNAT family N-acetyltransferase [Sphingobacteriaceae bacterium]
MDNVEISTDVSRLDIELIHRFLSLHSYWAKGIPLETVQRSIENSLCFGVYVNEEQVGFARLITDKATFAYLADVFILPDHQGKGLAGKLMVSIQSHRDLHGLRRWVLATADAHGLYEQFGFRPLSQPDRFMEIRNPEVYRRSDL